MIRNVWHSSATKDFVDVLVVDVLVGVDLNVEEAEFGGVNKSFDFWPSKSSTS